MKIRITSVNGMYPNFSVETTRSSEEIMKEARRIRCKADFDKREVTVKSERDLLAMERFLKAKISP